MDKNTLLKIKRICGYAFAVSAMLSLFVLMMSGFKLSADDTVTLRSAVMYLAWVVISAGVIVFFNKSQNNSEEKKMNWGGTVALVLVGAFIAFGVYKATAFLPQKTFSYNSLALGCALFGVTALSMIVFVFAKKKTALTKQEKIELENAKIRSEINKVKQGQEFEQKSRTSNGFSDSFEYAPLPDDEQDAKNGK